MSERGSKAVGTVAGALAFAVFFRRALPSDVVVAARDTLEMFLPLKTVMAHELLAGRLPTWFPYEGLGLSVVGTAVGGLFYPSTLLYFFLDPGQALKWSVLLSYPVAALGCGRLARHLGASLPGAWMAGLTFALSGYVLGVGNAVSLLFGASLLPWLLLATEHLVQAPTTGRAATLAACVALVLAGGDVEAFVVDAVVVAALVAVRLRALRPTAVQLAVTGALTAGFVLPILVPMWATFATSGRSGGMAPDLAMAWSLHPLRLLEGWLGPLIPASVTEAAAPSLGGYHGAFFTPSEHVGTAALVAFAVGAALRKPRSGFYVAIGVVGLLLALGRYGLVSPLLYRVVPFWRAFRYPEKVIPLALVSVAVLAGLGTTHVADLPKRAAAILGALATASLLLGASVESGFVHRWIADASAAEAIAPLLQGQLVLSAIALAVLAGGVWRGSAWVWVGVQAVQVLLWTGGWSDGGSATWAKAPSPLLASIPSDLRRAQGRICWDVPTYDFDDPPEAEPLSIAGDVATLATDYEALSDLGTTNSYMSGGAAAIDAACTRAPPCGSPCSRRLAGQMAIVSEAGAQRLVARGGVHEVARITEPHAVLVEDELARPWISLPAVRSVPSIAEAEPIFARVDPSAQEGAIGVGIPDVPAAQGSVRGSRPNAEEIAADLHLTQGGWVVIAEAHAPGWHAWLDEAQTPITTLDLAMMGVRVPPGDHHVDLRFIPPGWPWAWVPWWFAVAIAGLAWRRQWLERPAQPSSRSE